MKELKPFVHEDNRGRLMKVLKSSQIAPHMFGEVYVASMTPGCLRGNHYHKVSVEWFYVVSGRCLLVLENIATKEREEKELTPNIVVEIPPLYAHTLKNIGQDDVVFVAYTTLEFTPDDTVAYTVL